MEFKGDIIITDPCYIVKDDCDWGDCEYGEALEMLGINTYFTTDGGDCVGNLIVNTDNKEVLGEFCSDSSMVSVMLLDEVLVYNPTCLDNLGRHCYTIVKSFEGMVERIEIDDDEDQYWALVGKGNINFRSDCE
ncbi:MAG: hypothetical protein E7616_01080 [Ruminococcaceae bacterium]|nr:hypothetical protein [Oscillospiraceae bacterium]